MFQASGGKREESLRKARRERERRMHEWGSMGGIATPSLAPDLPFVYSPRAPLTRASHARLSRASLTRVSHARLTRAPTRLKTEKTTSVQHLILKREMPEFKVK